MKPNIINTAATQKDNIPKTIGAGVLALLVKIPKVKSYIKSILTELKTSQQNYH